MLSDRWVQDPLVPLATTVGGSTDRLGGDVLAQLPVSAWGRVVTVRMPPPDRLRELLAGVGRG